MTVSSVNEPSGVPSAPEAPPAHRPAATLAVTTSVTFLVLMDYTAPMTVLPDMTASLGTGLSGQAWLLNGIALGLAATLLVAGSLADDYGRKRVFVLGTLALAVTMALGAAATGTLAFTLARVAQGAASAAVIAASLGLIAHAFPSGTGRVRATALWGASLSGGIAAGPLVSSGLNVLSWRACYLALACAALLAAPVAVRTLRESRDRRPGRPDVLGAVTLGLALSALFAALTVGRDGWLRPAVWGLLAAAVALGAVFVAVERRSCAPMIDLALFRRPLFLVGTGGALFTGLAVIGLFSYAPTLLQQTVGLSPHATAWLLALWSGTALLTAAQSRRLVHRLGARHQLAAGFLLSALGMAALLGAAGGGSWGRLLPGLFVAGVGVGLLNAALPRLAVESVPPERAAMGSGANNTARYIGSAAGVALTVAVSTAHRDGDPLRALAAGTDRALLVACGLAIAGAAAVLALREKPLGQPGSGTEKPGTEKPGTEKRGTGTRDTASGNSPQDGARSRSTHIRRIG
ncbi:MFS transporter [Streptomyces winkii]|uniref:MFS transporter n=1 Tax=Streptomyces winkii TaxID=3051178 RepID=UPI0028D448A9|nr:MFS transporter [Streptomyces sp. DSM 40971]